MLYPAGRYNLSYDICSIAICAFVLLYLIATGNLRIRRIRSYFWLVVCMLLCSSGELAMDIARNDNGIFFTNAQAEALTFVSHVAHNSVPFLLVVHLLALSGLRHGLKRRDLVLISLPELILLVSHVIPPIRHLIYYYYGNCEYARGPLYCLYYLVVAFYVIYGVSVLVIKRSSIERHIIKYVTILCAGYLIGMIVGMANTYIRVTNFIQTLVLSSAFILLENENSLRDNVTGIYNIRGLTRDAFPLFHSSSTTYILSVKLQDINNYRLLVGMDAMGQMLHEMGSWMLGLASESRYFYRTGSGEFAILLFGASSDTASEFAELVRSRFSQPWHYSSGATELSVPAQVWVSSIPDSISTEEQVLAFAESAYNPDLPDDRVFFANEVQEEERRIRVDVAIRRAIANDTFEVYYQPIYDTSTGTIRSCEALVRMSDPELGQVSPEEFIKVAERSGTVSTIGSIVFEKVCRFISSADPARYGLDYVEVNLSPLQCMDPNLTSELTSIMDRYDVCAEQIVLEITESSVIHNPTQVHGIVHELRGVGFKFALDDFGTGEANYSYIRNFPFSIIKIDKSFLWSADKSRSDRIVLRSMLGLVKDLGLESVVEGVETQDQRDMLMRDGVNYLQGYLYSKPVPEVRFLDYVREFNAR